MPGVAAEEATEVAITGTDPTGDVADVVEEVEHKAEPKSAAFVIAQSIYFVNAHNDFAKPVEVKVTTVGTESALSTND